MPTALASVRSRYRLRDRPNRFQAVAPQLNTPRLRRQDDACSKPHEIARERQLTRFINVIDSPNEPAPRIKAHSKVLDVQIAHGQYNILITRLQLGAQFLPMLDPARERGAKKGKWPLPISSCLRATALCSRPSSR